MTPPQEQALARTIVVKVLAANTAAQAEEAVKAELAPLRADLQQKTDRIAELEQGADEMLAVWRNECDLRVKAQAYLQQITEERNELEAALRGARGARDKADAALRHVTEERARAMNVLEPNMPESGLEDACRQVKQAAISDRDNCEKLESALRHVTEELRGKLQPLLADMWAAHRDSEASGFNDCGDGKDCAWCEETKRILSALLRPEAQEEEQKG